LALPGEHSSLRSLPSRRLVRLSVSPLCFADVRCTFLKPQGQALFSLSLESSRLLRRMDTFPKCSEETTQPEAPRSMPWYMPSRNIIFENSAETVLCSYSTRCLPFPLLQSVISEASSTFTVSVPGSSISSLVYPFLSFGSRNRTSSGILSKFAESQFPG